MTPVEAAEDAIGRANRVHLALALLAAAAAVVVLLGLVRLPAKLSTVDAERTQLGQLLRSADDLTSQLRAFLLADYAGSANEAAAIRRLLHDARIAARSVDAVAARLAATPEVDITLRQDVNASLIYFSAMRNFNQALTGIERIDGEPTLHLAETILGTVQWAPSARGARLEDLVRLAYLASLRPAMLAPLSDSMARRDAPLQDTEMGAVRYHLKRTHDAAVSVFHTETRRAAAALWQNWLRRADTSAAFSATLATIDTDRLEALHLATLRRHDALQAQSQGDLPFTLPGVGQRIELDLALLAYPFVFAAGYLLIALHLRTARTNWADRPADEQAVLGTRPAYLFAAATPAAWTMAAALTAWAVFLAPVLPLAVAAWPVSTAQVGRPEGPVAWLGMALLLLALVVSAVQLAQLRRALARTGRPADRAAPGNPPGG